MSFEFVITDLHNVHREQDTLAELLAANAALTFTLKDPLGPHNIITDRRGNLTLLDATLTSANTLRTNQASLLIAPRQLMEELLQPNTSEFDEDVGYASRGAANQVFAQVDADDPEGHVSLYGHDCYLVNRNGPSLQEYQVLNHNNKLFFKLQQPGREILDLTQLTDDYHLLIDPCQLPVTRESLNDLLIYSQATLIKLNKPLDECLSSEDYGCLELQDARIVAGFGILVDTGQFGVISLRDALQWGGGDYDDESSDYRMVCDITMHNNSGWFDGYQDASWFTRTGWGDGHFAAMYNNGRLIVDT